MYRSHRSGKHHPITPKQGTIFNEPKNESLAEKVHAENISDAEESASTLRDEFAGAKTRAKKEGIWRATLQEANRLEIGANNPHNSPEARMSLRKREAVFRSTANRMHSQLYPAGGSS